MALKGFDPKFKDFPDYILGITQEIWEGRGISTLNKYYAKDLPMRFPDGLVTGNEAVKNGTLATLAEFPDRELLGEDVIWCGNEDDGFLSSHRIVTTGTHLGHGYFGPPTGKRFEIRAMADCAAIDNAINDEWLIRDVSGIVKQLGMKPKRFARKLIEREGGAASCKKPFTPDVDVEGPYQSHGNDNAWGAKLADILTRMMDKDFTVIREAYDRACRVEHPGALGGWSHRFAEHRWMLLRSAFPNAEFKVHHVIGRNDPDQAPKASVRWSLHGKHEGFGDYGEPTGSEVYIMGNTHAEFGPWGLRREYTLFDEVSIWKSILIHQDQQASASE